MWKTIRFKDRLGVLIAALVVLTTPHATLAADINLYAEATTTGDDFIVRLYADISKGALLSFGVSLNYDPDELSVISAQKNEAVWYFGDGEIKHPYLEPETSQPGRIVMLGARLDTDSPSTGTDGLGVLLGQVIFDKKISGNPSLSLERGRGGSYNNFVTADGTVLETAADGVTFGTITFLDDRSQPGSGGGGGGCFIDSLIMSGTLLDHLFAEGLENRRVKPQASAEDTAVWTGGGP